MRVYQPTTTTGKTTAAHVYFHCTYTTHASPYMYAIPMHIHARARHENKICIYMPAIGTRAILINVYLMCAATFIVSCALLRNIKISEA